MSYEILYLGWNNEPGHDKIWGYVKLGPTLYFNFWGKRGKTIMFQEQTGYREIAMRKAARAKTKKGYREVDLTKVDEVVPDFIETFEHELTMARLFNNFKV